MSLSVGRVKHVNNHYNTLDVSLVVSDPISGVAQDRETSSDDEGIYAV